MVNIGSLLVGEIKNPNQNKTGKRKGAAFKIAEPRFPSNGVLSANTFHLGELSALSCLWSKRLGMGRRGRMWINEYIFPVTFPGCLRKWWASRGNWGRHLRWACYRRAIQQQACTHRQKSPRFFIPMPYRKNTKGARSSLSWGGSLSYMGAVLKVVIVFLK